MNAIAPEHLLTLYAYFHLSGFPAKAVYMGDNELDYSGLQHEKAIFDAVADGRYPAPWIYVWSRAKGSGKSMLASRAAIRFGLHRCGPFFLPSFRDDLGIELAKIRFAPVPELMVKIRKTMTPKAAFSEDDVLQPLKDADFLVLDDIGAENGSDFTARVLADVINSRSLHPHRPTIITANRSLNGLVDHLAVSEDAREHAERVVDRIEELAHVIELPDSNFRSLGTPNAAWLPMARKVERLAERSRLLSELRDEVWLG